MIQVKKNNCFLISYLFLLAVISCSKEESNNEIVIPEIPKDSATVVDCPGTTFNFAILPPSDEEINLSNYALAWEDDFDYPGSQLEENWTSQNGPSGHIDCGRYRENAKVVDGVLELEGRKENRGGQEWTCGNIWTKEKFGYGYYEARYKYAGATGTNNSFWLFGSPDPNDPNKIFCELDINEGWYPNRINTNVRHHIKGKGSSSDTYRSEDGLSYAYGHTFEEGVKTNKIRFSSKNGFHFHVREFRIYEQNENCYPTDVLSSTIDNSIDGLNNLARGSEVSIEVSGFLDDDADRFPLTNMTDGTINSAWVSQLNGEKWIEFTWPTEQEIGHIQFVNGWLNNGVWNQTITDYKIEALVNDEWVELGSFDLVEDKGIDYSENFHVYGMAWTENEIKYYFNNKLLKTYKNTECFEELTIFLSLAIFDVAGEVTDAIDGTSMKIDWVRYYEPL